jgi:erythromycin esterase-like protein
MRSLIALLAAVAWGCASPPDPAPALAAHAHPLTGAPADYDPLLAAIGNASVVLLGEATHGTREFYVERARITQRLVREKSFSALALEANWDDAEQIDRYVRGEDVEPLARFDEFPRWMWRNREFADLVEWLREHNRTAAVKVGVYGLDLYGVEESREALRRGVTSFAAEQHARVVKAGEEYERTGSWNLRDRHMVVTIDQLQRHLIATTGTGKVIVWAHNSHVGDARATGRARYGEWNMGQLVREHWPRGASFTVGFMTHRGTVMAAHDWGGAPRVQQLRESMRGSHGALLHETGLPRFLIILSEVEARAVRGARLQRAVGVIYRPMDEYASHYYTATLREQFDAVVHIDETTAVTPLDQVNQQR